MEPDTEFYSNTGHGVCYSPDGENIYLWDGVSVAYLEDEKVYSFSGLFLGWFSDGWLYDRNNRPALFSENSDEGPPRPSRQVCPTKSARHSRPAKGSKQPTHSRPAQSSSWSDFSNESYFNQNQNE